MKKLYGTYLNKNEAEKSLEKILKEGYKREDIFLLSKDAFENYIDVNMDIDKEFFKKYKGILKDEQFVILVEERDARQKKAPDWDQREKEFYED